MLASHPSLPRESRDTLLVLAVVALVLLPQVAYLPLWTSTLALGLLAWRLWMVRKGHSLPGKWLLAALLVLAVGATVLQFRSIVGAEAGVVLVVLLLVLKTLEMRARRDAMVIFFLGFFTLLTLFLQSQSLSMAVAMLLAVWGLLAALVNAHMPAGYPSLRQLLRTSGVLMLLGTPIMLVLFLTFPRMAPLWGLPSQQAQGRTGLTNDMTVGDVAQLAHNRDIAMRVRFDTPDHQPPPLHLLYFRGPVLSEFDGRHWKSPSDGGMTTLPPGSTMPAAGLGEPIGYEVTLEPHQQRWLLTLEATVVQPQAAVRRITPTADLQWLSPRPITEVLRYQGQAYLQFAYGHSLRHTQRQQFTHLPAHLNPRTTAWALALRDQHGSDDAAIIQSALSHLRKGGYVYTLQPGIVHSAHTADHFWFDGRQGFCEHISSAFVVLMRAAGIPARIVTGY
ncbi:MAG: transglutaminaseTgpA domain-containing protein, partial [Comamonas sp.]